MVKGLFYLFTTDCLRPNMMQDLVHMLQSPNMNQSDMEKALTTTLQLVKELTKARLVRSRNIIYATSNQLFSALLPTYTGFHTLWSGSQLHMPLHIGSVASSPQLKASSDSFKLQVLKISDLAFKIMSRLAIAGYEIPQEKEEVRLFWQSTHFQLKTFLSILDRPTLVDIEGRACLERYIRHIAKFHMATAAIDGNAFSELPDTPALVIMYWEHAKVARARQRQLLAEPPDRKSLEEVICLRTLLLLRACFRLVRETSPLCLMLIASAVLTFVHC